MVNAIKPDAEYSINTERTQDFNIDFETRLNMFRAMVKVLDNMNLVDAFTSVSGRSMRIEEDKAMYMAMREELLRRLKTMKVVNDQWEQTEIIIQNPDGREITMDDIINRVEDADVIYVRVDHNAAYWVKGKEKGKVRLW